MNSSTGSVDIPLGGTVEQRLSHAEQRIAAMENEMRHLAKKADIHQMETHIVKWIVGGVGTTAVLAASLTGILVKLLVS